jgi:DNA-binding GntR family transcriptional regulator
VNREFHGEIAAAGGNEILHDAVTNLHVRLIRYFYKVISMDSYGKELVDEHRDIAKAIRNRQSERAGEMARRHLQKTNERSAKLSFGLPGWTGQAALTPSLDNGAGGTKRRRRVL